MSDYKEVSPLDLAPGDVVLDAQGEPWRVVELDREEFLFNPRRPVLTVVTAEPARGSRMRSSRPVRWQWYPHARITVRAAVPAQAAA